MRLFVAVHLPELLLQKLDALQHTLRAELPFSFVRWTKPAQIHLTLRFFGQVPESELERLGIGLKEAAQQVRPLQLSLKGLGLFPDSRRPRVLWAGIAEEHDELQRLHQAVAERTHSWGTEENRPFRPHLTLARLKDVRPRQAGQLAEILERYSAGALGSWTVSSVELMRSELSAEGARHHSQGSFPLGLIKSR